MTIFRKPALLAFALVLLGTGSAPLAQMGPMPVDVAKPLVARIVDWDEYTGRFAAVQRVELRARVSGYLDKVSFTDGQIVTKGDVLFTIDPRPFQAEYARLDAELKAARAQQALAVAQLNRSEQLVTRNRNVVAESTLDERRATRLGADARVDVAQAALRGAALNLAFTEVKAPFTGRISERRVDPGNLVTAGDTLLATIVSIDPIHLVFTASEADFLKYERLHVRGDRPSSRTAAHRVEARLIDEQGWPHKGTMDFVANELDRNAGTITLRAVLSNSDHLLAPGLFARVRLIASGEYEALLIPDAAVLSDQASKIVMVVDSEGTVSIRPVTPGPLYRGLRVIRSGLSAGDRVVVSGVQRARPGGKVVAQEKALSLPPPESGDTKKQ